MSTPEKGTEQDSVEYSIEGRVEREFHDLRVRANKLKRFLCSPEMANVNGTQEFLMREQLEHMIDYKMVLMLRLKEMARNTPGTRIANL